jgi:selenocysteine-specific elongation factor
VKHWTPIHIYNATSHSTGRLALLADSRLAPGQTGMVDLICDEPLAVRHGDQLVLRDQSLDVTLGGATVLHANTTPTLRRRSEPRLRKLTHYAQATPTACLVGLLSDGVTDMEGFRQVWNLTAEQTQALVQDQDALRIDDLAFSKALWSKLQVEILQTVEAHQSEHPSSPGLKENSFTEVAAELRQAVLSALVQSNKLANEAGLYRLPEHKAELPEALSKVWQRLEPELDKKQAPSTGDIAKLWRVAQPQLESDLKELTKRGLVTHIANHRFYLPRQLEALADDVKVLAGQKPFSVREFRDATSIGRNVAIEILEYFDRRGFTRRQDNERIVLKDKL